MKKIYAFLLLLLFLGSSQLCQAQTQVVFHTNMGPFIVQMHDTLMPITVNNFLDLTKKGYYDGTIFHRIIGNFVIQGGDPTGTGSGGPGYTIPDEFDSTLSNVQWTIAMANAGPNTGGSQFFINLKDNTFLDFDKAPSTSKHPVFGFVLHNISIVSNIGMVATDGNDRPINDVVIDSLRILFSPTTAIEVKDAPPSPISIHPNPINEKSVISWESDTRKTIYFSVFDASGKNYRSQYRTIEKRQNEIPLREIIPSSLSSGVYFLATFDGKNIYHEKIIIPTTP